MSTTNRPDHPPPRPSRRRPPGAALGPAGAVAGRSPVDLGSVWAMSPPTWLVSGLCLGHVACHLGCVWAVSGLCCLSPGLCLGSMYFPRFEPFLVDGLPPCRRPCYLYQGLLYVLRLEHFLVEG